VMYISIGIFLIIAAVLLPPIFSGSGAEWFVWEFQIVIIAIGSFLVGKWLEDDVAKPLREMNEKKSLHSTKCIGTRRKSDV